MGVNMLVSTKNKILKYILLVIVIVILFNFSVFTLAPAVDVLNEGISSQITQDGITVPIVMYHSLLKKSDHMGKYVITPMEFENDVKYLKNHGYTAISMTELINYVYNGTELPPKPVIITFDDGNLNNYIYGLSVLKKYEMKAVLSIVGEYSEAFSQNPPPSKNPYNAFVSWEQVKAISQSGYFEIQNHTYSLHSIDSTRYGIKQKKGESLESYRAMLIQDISGLQEKIYEVTGVKPNTFTYPFGYSNKEAREIIKILGFKASLSCAEGINYVYKNKPETLFGLKRKNRPHGTSTYEFFKSFCS